MRNVHRGCEMEIVTQTFGEPDPESRPSWFKHGSRNSNPISEFLNYTSAYSFRKKTNDKDVNDFKHHN